MPPHAAAFTMPDQVNGLIRRKLSTILSTAQRGLSAGNVLIRPVSNPFTILSMVRCCSTVLVFLRVRETSNGKTLNDVIRLTLAGGQISVFSFPYFMRTANGKF